MKKNTPPYRILIIDDNPFPTREFLIVILNKFKKHFSLLEDFDESVQKHYYSEYDKLSNDYTNLIGKDFHFLLKNNISVSIYNYNPINTEQNNQINILKIIKQRKINIFWTDRGQSQFRLDNGNMYEVINQNNTTSDKLFQNKEIIKQLKKNEIRQVAVYSFNPKLTVHEIEYRKDLIYNTFNPSKKVILSSDNIYVLETSPILNLFDPNDRLSAGDESDMFLGTLKAFEYYGKLLGCVLFDLFLQLEENKSKLSENDKRYNFFNRYNRSFLRYFKHLNSSIVNKQYDFKIGMVSFFGKVNGQKHYLIDVPYKEYYEVYDMLLGTGNPPIGTIIKPIEKDVNNESNKWIYFKYKKDKNGKFQVYAELEKSISTRKSIVKDYLPLLHTAIFYEPEFYNLSSFPFNKFKIVSKSKFTCEILNGCVEVIYLFKKVNFEGINFDGVSHLVVWRRVKPNSNVIKIEDTVNEIWENYYRLVEPKLEASLVSIFHGETLRQAIRAAISQVMARNMSHNIGSHVLANVLSVGVVEKHAKILMNYLKLRQEFLADISTSSAAVNFSHNLYEDILSKFCPVTDSERGIKGDNPSCFYMENNKPTGNYTLNFPMYVLDNISGKSNLKKEQIKFDCCFLNKALTVNVVDKSYIRSVCNDVAIDIPNDILGFQALYILLENLIRNSSKHSKCSELFYDLKLTDNIEFPDYYKVEISDRLGNENAYKRHLSGWIDRISGYIYNSILDNNRLRDGGWGMLEMKICAAYLISYPLEYLDSYNKQTYEGNEGVVIDGKKYPPLIKAVLDDKNNLSYIFYLRKPKSVLIIDNCEQNGKVESLESNVFKNKGIYSGIQSDWKNKGTEHDFLVIKNGESTFETNKYEHETNQDVLLVDDSFLENPSPETLLDKVWIEKVKEKDTPIYFVDGNSNETTEGIVFDDHGQWGFRYPQKLQHITYYEPYSSQSATNQILKSDYDNRRNENGLPFQAIQAQIRDAAHTGIIVIDERIQKATNVVENISTEIAKYKHEILNGMGIYLPVSPKTTQEISAEKKDINVCLSSGLPLINLAESDFDNEVCRKWINHFISTKKNVKYLVIHLGIIEKLAGSTDQQNILDWIYKKEWLDEENKSCNFRIVVTSGRGLPSNLPDGVLYVSISSIQQYIVNYRSKLMLVKLLKSIRKIYKSN